MRLIVTGATGLAGGEVLRQALADVSVESVLVPGRRSCGLHHEKLREVILQDFMAYGPSVEALLAGHDACVWCLGVSQNDVGRDEYVRITYDYALYAAKTMLRLNPSMRFCFLSGQGADREEKAFTLFGKIKGRAERDLAALGPEIYCFRPGFIEPSVPRARPRLMERLLRPFVPLGGMLTDNFSVSSGRLARCMLAVAANGSSSHLFSNAMIRSHY